HLAPPILDMPGVVTNVCPIYARKQPKKPKTSRDRNAQGPCSYWVTVKQAETVKNILAALTRRTKLCHGLYTTPTAARSSVGMRYPQRVLREGLTALALLALAPCALAQPMSVAEIASYQGADREQRLIEGAKREKELTFYSSIPPDDIAA